MLTQWGGEMAVLMMWPCVRRWHAAEYERKESEVAGIE